MRGSPREELVEMEQHRRDLGHASRVGLAGVRLAMGSLALVTPDVVAGRLGARPGQVPGLSYPLRMFGVRTIVIALELLSPQPAVRASALRVAPLIHATDLLAALDAGRRGELPRRMAATTAAISSVNTVLALLASRRARATSAAAPKEAAA
jgi:hypothetical protein